MEIFSLNWPKYSQIFNFISNDCFNLVKLCQKSIIEREKERERKGVKEREGLIEGRRERQRGREREGMCDREEVREKKEIKQGYLIEKLLLNC